METGFNSKVHLNCNTSRICLFLIPNNVCCQTLYGKLILTWCFCLTAFQAPVLTPIRPLPNGSKLRVPLQNHKPHCAYLLFPLPLFTLGSYLGSYLQHPFVESVLILRHSACRFACCSGCAAKQCMRAQDAQHA